jgi:hypothetical protein
MGSEMSTIELLSLATKLVDATKEPAIDGLENVVRFRPSYDQLPLDEAFADGGWRIMARDRAYTFDEFEDDQCLSARITTRLNLLLKRAA